MKKSYFFLFIFSCLLFIVLGCGGGGPGSPGSDGSERTGVTLDGTITPEYAGTDTYSVDAFRNPDCDGDPTTSDAEFFADHNATLTVSAGLLNPAPTFKPGTLYVEKYTIKYKRSSDSIGAPPIEQDVRYDNMVIYPPLNLSLVNTYEFPVIFLDLVRKIQYADDILSGRYTSNILNNYTAIFKFEGKNEYGEEFSFEVQRDFQIGDFDNCGG